MHCFCPRMRIVLTRCGGAYQGMSPMRWIDTVKGQGHGVLAVVIVVLPLLRRGAVCRGEPGGHRGLSLRISIRSSSGSSAGFASRSVRRSTTRGPGPTGRRSGPRRTARRPDGMRTLQQAQAHLHAALTPKRPQVVAVVVASPTSRHRRTAQQHWDDPDQVTPQRRSAPGPAEAGRGSCCDRLRAIVASLWGGGCRPNASISSSMICRLTRRGRR